MISELVAMSCAVLPDAWPVAATGSSDSRETASQMTDHRQLSVSRCPIPATSVMIAAQRHEDAMSIWLIATNHWSGGSDWRKVRPETSDRVSGMSSAAAIAQAVFAHDEICCMR